MFEAFVALPAEMPRDHKCRFWESIHRFFDACRPCRQIGVGDIAQALVAGVFDKTTAVKGPFFGKPYDDVVLGMAFARIKRFEPVVSERECSVFGEIKFRLLFVVLPAQIECLPGSIRLNSFAFEKFEPGRPVVVIMRRNAELHLFAVLS